MKTKLPELVTRIGYSFNDSALLNTALRHRSAGKNSNERMEFLGDSILNFTIAAELFKRYPELHEGELSRLRSNLVNEDSLAELARDFKLGDCLQLGIGERKSGGHHRTSILADAMEATIGAIYLDGGIEICRSTVLIWYDSRLNSLLTEAMKDPKTELQEYLQANKIDLPKYEIILTEGELHEQIFHVSCTIKKMRLITEGVGPSKQKAEQDAAKKALVRMNKKNS
jgi:ribonuclease-3